MSIKDLSFDFVFKWEGVLSDDAADRGGLTKYGISLEFAKSVRADIDGDGVVTRKDIQALTIDDARELFDKNFWRALKCDDFEAPVAFALFNAGTNTGVRRSRVLLQRGINRVNLCVLGISAPIADDGRVGPCTIAAYNALMAKGLARVLALALVVELMNFYRAIVKNNPSQRVFLNGWLNRAKDAQQTILEM